MLATSIAETSLTIEGVRVVIDSGLMRAPRYEPDVGLTRLETLRVSRANADQRRGRAGRVEPGVCYRLWEEAGTAASRHSRRRRSSPPILPAWRSTSRFGASLTPRRSSSSIRRRAPRSRRRALCSLRSARSTARGGSPTRASAIAGLALPPRLARMVVDAARVGEAQLAADLAVVLTERGLGGDAVDLTRRLENFRRDRSPRAEDARRLARNLASRAAASFPPRGRRWRGEAATDEGDARRAADLRERRILLRQPRRRSAPVWAHTRQLAPSGDNPSSVIPAGRHLPPQRGKGRAPERPNENVGEWLAAAFPDRIAMARGKRGEFLMANGRAATLEPHDPLAGEAYLAIGEIVGRAAAARIVAAAPLTIEQIEAVAGGAIETREETAFDRASASLRARRRRKLGALTLVEGSLSPPADEASALALARGILDLGAARLPWTKPLAQWRGRVNFLRRAEGEQWPDLSDSALAASPDWLTPFLIGKTRLDEFSSDELGQALHALLAYDLQRRLEAEAPSHYVAPTGTSAPVDYEFEGGPSVALRVQELFGLAVHPALAGGRVPLTLHLLSPAHRPIQITRDLPGFWKGSWAATRADLRGRYPRHFWPEDPANAAPTSRAKPRGT